MYSTIAILEANKENMTAQVYFALKQELEKTRYCEITYVCPRFEPCRDGYNTLEMSLRKVIVPCFQDINRYTNEIQRDGFTHIPGRLLNRAVETTHFVYDTDRDTRMDTGEENEEIETGSVYPCVQVEMERVCVTSINKVFDK